MPSWSLAHGALYRVSPATPPPKFAYTMPTLCRLLQFELP